MGKTCYQADDHRWGAGKTHLITEDGLMTRCGKSIAVIPGRLIDAESYNCKGCRAAKERDAQRQLREQPVHSWEPSLTERARAAGVGPSDLPRADRRPPPMNYENNGPTSMNDFLMPFGKHRGTPVYDLDDGYLEWLRDNVDLYGGLRQAVYAELEERGIGDGGEG
jgi:hypothetical protein